MDDPTEYCIDFVRLVNGKIPFINFLDSLDKNERAKVLAMLEEFRLRRTAGMRIPESISKHLDDGIFELRVRHPNRITRSLYFFLSRKRIIFTHGFIKKTERTSFEEIDKAKKYRMEYLNLIGE